MFRIELLLVPFVFVCIIFHQTNGANILGMFPFPGKSHFLMFESVLKGLAAKGHDVDVVSFFPQKKPIPRYRDISLVGTMPIIQGDGNFTDILVRMTTPDMINLITTVGEDCCRLLQNTPQMQQLKTTTKKYDVVLVEIFGADCFLGWGYHFKVPTVSLTSSVALPWSNDRLGNPDNPSYIPHYFMDYLPRMNFYERLHNAFSLIGVKLAYHDISLVGIMPIIQGDGNFTDILVRMTIPHQMNLLATLTEDSCSLLQKAPQMQQLKTTTKKYDVVLVELFGTDCFLGWGHHFKVPTVALTSSVAMTWSNDRLGNPDNPSYIPHYFMNYLPRMNFYERFLNAFSLIGVNLAYHFKSHSINEKLAKQFFGDDLPDLTDMMYNTSLLLVNSHFSLHQARPTVPNFVEVAGVHIGKPQPLDKYFDKAIATDSEGIIYFTMGSIIQSERIPVYKIQAIFDAFEKLPFKVLWKAGAENFSKQLRIPKNIHFENWMPQLDILCHPNVKLFVSHGGLMSTQEAIYCGVPVMGIPLFADQDLNIRYLEQLGSAIHVPYDQITEEAISNAARELLYNPKYQETSKKTSNIFKDRPLSPLDTAIYWIEYVIRYDGAPQLRSIARELYWFQYYLVDVAVVAILIVIGVIYGLYFSVTRLFCRQVAKKKIKSN